MALWSAFSPRHRPRLSIGPARPHAFSAIHGRCPRCSGFHPFQEPAYRERENMGLQSTTKMPSLVRACG